MAELQTGQDDKARQVCNNNSPSQSCALTQSAAALQHEQDEKARLRYKAAMSKVKLEKVCTIYKRTYTRPQ